MIIRPFKSTDMEGLRSLGEQPFDVPDLTSRHHIATDTVIDHGKIVGAGTLRLTSEGILILDPNLSHKDRAFAVTELLRLGLFKGQKLGLDEMHVFLTGPHAESFAEILKEHFGFINCKGIPLTLRF